MKINDQLDITFHRGIFRSLGHNDPRVKLASGAGAVSQKTFEQSRFQRAALFEIVTPEKMTDKLVNAVKLDDPALVTKRASHRLTNLDRPVTSAGGTALALSIERQSFKARDALLNVATVNVNTPDTKGNTPAFVAMNQGDLNSLWKLLQTGNVNHDVSNTRGHSLITHAANEGNADALAMLLHHGFDPAHQDAKGRTAVELVIERAHPSCLAVMLTANVTLTKAQIDKALTRIEAGLERAREGEMAGLKQRIIELALAPPEQTGLTRRSPVAQRVEDFLSAQSLLQTKRAQLEASTST